MRQCGRKRARTDRNALIDVLTTASGIGFGIDMATGGAAQDHLIKRLILDLVMASMYVALPVLWSAMAGWAGYNAIRYVNDAAKPLSQGPEKAGGTAPKSVLKF